MEVFCCCCCVVSQKYSITISTKSIIECLTLASVNGVHFGIVYKVWQIIKQNIIICKYGITQKRHLGEVLKG